MTKFQKSLIENNATLLFPDNNPLSFKIAPITGTTLSGAKAKSINVHLMPISYQDDEFGSCTVFLLSETTRDLTKNHRFRLKIGSVIMDESGIYEVQDIIESNLMRGKHPILITKPVEAA